MYCRRSGLNLRQNRRPDCRHWVPRKHTMIFFLILYWTNRFHYLFSGVLLTLSIALFHGKCHILRRTEVLAGFLIPHKKIINDSRTYSFGWSFVLAWMCVFLCFISSFVWLYKAQDPRTSRTPGSNYVRHRAYTSGDYVVYMDDNEYYEYNSGW